jgi:succinate dehydrogenase/fumarate reductase flavoprotein subunit
MSKEVVTEAEVDARIERLVFRYAGQKTVREIGELAGITPDQVIRVKQRVFDNIDVLDINQRRAKLMMDLQTIADEAIEAFRNESEAKAKGPLLSAATQAIKSVLAEVRNLEKQSTGEVNALNAKRVEELLRLVDVVVMELIDFVVENTDLEQETLLILVQKLLVKAAQEADSDLF